MFDELGRVYDALVEWPKRLAQEGPFYRRLFQRVGVRSVLDVACGTGRHAAMFEQWGLRVEGADISPQMIHQARTAFGETPNLRWVVRGFDQPIPTAEPFDAAICVGNSLALAPYWSTAERAVAHMVGAVRPGGVVVIHVLNLAHLPDGPCHWQKLQRTPASQGEVLVLKGVHRSGDHGYLDLVIIDPAQARIAHQESVRLLGFGAAELAKMAKRAGAAKVQLFGGYQEEPFDPIHSPDLVLVAQRA